MTIVRPLSPLLLLVLAACASHSPKSAPPAAEPVEAAATTTITPPSTTADGDAAATVADPAANSVATEPAVPAPTDGDAATTPTSAEDDYAALYGTPPASSDGNASPAAAYDPWEGYNRRVHRFNLVVDKYLARPVATGYTKVVPATARLGVTNFFDNLRSPVTLVNQLLQGHPVKALQTLGRFALNSTLGFAGLFDPATSAGIPRGNEDFGQTLGVWGWRNSRYFELPFFGPRTLRDTFGLAGDIPLSPLRQIEEDKVRYGLQGVQLINTRSRLLSLDEMREQAPDEYALTRDAWMQRRNYQIRQHQQQEQNPADPLRDEQTVPVDAMPVPELSN